MFEPLAKNAKKKFLVCFVVWFCFLSFAVHGLHTCSDGNPCSYNIPSYFHTSDESGTDPGFRDAAKGLKIYRASQTDDNHDGHACHGACSACFYLAGSQSTVDAYVALTVYHTAAILSQAPLAEIFVVPDKHIKFIPHAPPSMFV